MSSTNCYQLEFDSPIGVLTLLADDEALCQLRFPCAAPLPPEQQGQTVETPLLCEARAQVLAFLAGSRRDFDLPLRPAGTPFQLRAWRALQAIPYGETRSYAEQARAIEAPRAVRAVGAANGRNPLPIIVPCHRVIGTSGALTGFGGGLQTKRWLLRLEAAQAGQGQLALG